MADATAVIHQLAEGNVNLIDIDVAASIDMLQGIGAVLDANGDAAQAGDDASVQSLGVVDRGADNSSGAAGDVTALVRTAGLAVFTQAALVDADRGKAVYWVDNQTVALEATVTHNVLAGWIWKVPTATTVQIIIAGPQDQPVAVPGAYTVTNHTADKVMDADAAAAAEIADVLGSLILDLINNGTLKGSVT